MAAVRTSIANYRPLFSAITFCEYSLLFCVLFIIRFLSTKCDGWSVKCRLLFGSNCMCNNSFLFQICDFFFLFGWHFAQANKTTNNNNKNEGKTLGRSFVKCCVNTVNAMGSKIKQKKYNKITENTSTSREQRITDFGNHFLRYLSRE